MAATVTWPTPKPSASDLVREAYRGWLSRSRVGLTEADRRQLRAAVQRGKLAYGQDPNLPRGFVGWSPIAQRREEDLWSTKTA